MDWTDLYASNDIDVVGNIFEEKMKKVLDKMAPIRVFQKRKKFRKWISQEVKTEMRNRDTLREEARRTGQQVDWASYRRARNECVKSLKNSKSDYFNKVFDQIDKEHDMKKTLQTNGRAQ